MFVVIGAADEGPDRRRVRPAGQQTRPQLDRLGRVRPGGAVGGQVAQRRVREDFGLGGLWREERHQRAMPIDFVPADPHRRIDEAVSELSPLFKRGRRPQDRFLVRPGAVQQQPEAVGPDLGVAGHGLAVESNVVRAAH